MTKVENLLSSILGDLLMIGIESDLHSKGSHSNIWTRYVDDTVSIILRDKVQKMPNAVEKEYQNLRFTREVRDDRVLPFLNLKIMRGEKGFPLTIIGNPLTQKEQFQKVLTTHI